MSVKERIRVSCAGLASIELNGKYLLIQNKKSRKDGRIIYGPLGGALEYSTSEFGSEALIFLNRLRANLERETTDLRMIIDVDDVDLFEVWFKNTKQRERTCKRELCEELVTEEKILTKLNDFDMTEECVGMFRDKRARWNEVMTERFFEIYKITFSPEIEKKLVEISKDPNSTIKLISKAEILKQCGKDSEIGFHSKFIILD